MSRRGPHPLTVGRRPPTIVLAVGAALLLCSPWASSAHAEIFEGSGFESIKWKMHIADAEKAMAPHVSRVRNEHTGNEYLRAARYQYLGCTYVLVLNFDEPGEKLSEIVLTHRREARAETAEKSCRDGVSGLIEKMGRPISEDQGARVWRLKTTTITVIEGRRGDLQIRYTPSTSPAAAS